MKPDILHSVVAAILVGVMIMIAATPGTARAQTPEALILNGFHAQAPASNPRPVLFNNTRYRFETAGVPINRAAIRQTDVLYFDRLPEGVELFRDDMEAIHKLVSDGGVAFLIAGGDTSNATIAGFNYLGGRFNFSFSESPRPATQILPAEPLAGFMGGNVWHCEKGVRTLSLGSADWIVRYRDASTGQPVVATRKIGRGLVILMGTNEIDRPAGVPPQTGLTLVDWARTSLADNSADSIASPTPHRAATSRQMREAINNPRGSSITDRVQQLRAVYYPGRPNGASRMMLAPEQRPAFARPRQMVDSEGRALHPDYFARQATIVVAWATWEPQSIDYLRDIAALAESAPSPLQVLAVNLDADKAAFQAARAEFDLAGWSHLHDGQALSSPLARSLGITAVPRAFIVDRNLRVAAIDPPAPMVSELITSLGNGQRQAWQ